MIVINNSNFHFKIKQENNTDFIFDEIRKKWLVLQPEEWIRQNFIQFLTHTLQYPAKLIAIEKQIKVETLTKRFDIVVYKDDKPWMLVECKQIDVTLDDKALQQILAYASVMTCEYFIITNGNQTFCWKNENGNLVQQFSMPLYNKKP